LRSIESRERANQRFSILLSVLSKEVLCLCTYQRENESLERRRRGGGRDGGGQRRRSLVNQQVQRFLVLTDSIQMLQRAFWQTHNAWPRCGPACWCSLCARLSCCCCGIGASRNNTLALTGAEMHHHNDKGQEKKGSRQNFEGLGACVGVGRRAFSVGWGGGGVLGGPFS